MVKHVQPKDNVLALLVYVFYSLIGQATLRDVYWWCWPQCVKNGKV